MTKEFLSDIQIEQILEKASSAYRHNKLPKNGHDNFILSLKTYIIDRGVMENVCRTCMGTGKKINHSSETFYRMQDIKKLLAQTEPLGMVAKSKEQLAAEGENNKEEFLSELQIDHVIQKVRRVLKLHPIESYADMEELRTALKEPSVLEDACPLCKGIGKKRMRLGGEKGSSIIIDEWLEMQKNDKRTPDEVYEKTYLCKPVPPMHPDERDCRDCEFIDIDTYPHIFCNRYNVKIKSEYPERLRPCDECGEVMLKEWKNNNLKQQEL